MEVYHTVKESKFMLAEYLTMVVGKKVLKTAWES
jgi:hypothetical protein